MRTTSLKRPSSIENGYATALKLGMFGAPSGVLIDENGVIVTETAVGVPVFGHLSESTIR